MTSAVIELLGPSTGGIRRHVAALTDDLRADGWRVVVAGPSGVLADAVRVDVPAGLSPTGLRAARAQLRALVAAESPDVIHAHGLKAGWVAVGVDSGRTVLTVHNVVLSGGVRGRVLRWLERSVVRHSRAVIATSREIAGRLRAQAPDIVVVEPVHDVRPPQRTRDAVREALGVSGALVVSVGRLHTQKGLDTLVRAVALLGDAAVTVVVAGEGPEQGRLQALIDESAVEHRIRLLGARDDVADLMAAADVVVFTSTWESGPLTLLEAGAVSAPVVTTPVGFVPDIVRDGESGLIVPIDDPAAVAAAIMALVDDPERARVMGEALAIAVAPRLDRTGPLAAVEAVYRRAMGAAS